jgi:hypothetical protein
LKSYFRKSKKLGPTCWRTSWSTVWGCGVSIQLPLDDSSSHASHAARQSTQPLFTEGTIGNVERLLNIALNIA